MRSMSWTKNLNGMPIGIWTRIKNNSWAEEIISWKFISFFYFQEPWRNRFAAWRRWRFSQLTLIRRAKLWLTTKLSARNGTATFAKPLLCLRCSLSIVLCPSIVCRFGYDAIDAIMTQFNLAYKMPLLPFVRLVLLVVYQLIVLSLLLQFLLKRHLMSDSRCWWVFPSLLWTK